jgi:hypothetical protein
MRISSQNNQFVFNLPENFINDELEEKFKKLMDKNFIPYNTVMDYINSTIKDIVFPSVSYETAEQHLKHGKRIVWREAGNVMDKFQGEIDVTFRSIDSHLNYFMITECLNNFYLNKENYLDLISINILDKDGDVIYTILLKDVVYKSVSEIRLAYYATLFDEQTFTIQFAYNYIDIRWELNDYDLNGKSIFDINIKEGDPRDVSGLEKEMKNRKK